MAHAETDEHAAVTAVLLHGRILKLNEAYLAAKQLAEFHRYRVRLPPISRGERVVVECDSVDDGNEEQRPVSATLGLVGIVAVIYREKDMCCPAEVRQRLTESAGVGCLENHKRHAGAEKHDVRGFILGQKLPLEVSKRINEHPEC